MLEEKGMGWTTRLILSGVAVVIGYAAYDMHKVGYFSVPDLPIGAYVVSFKNGLRGIVMDVEVSDQSYENRHKFFRRLSNANPDRRYLGIPFDVAPWFEDSWSTCSPPTDEEREYIASTMPDETERTLIGARFDAFCYIEVDGGQRIARGLIYSVPKT